MLSLPPGAPCYDQGPTQKLIGGRLASELVAWMKAHKLGTVLDDVEQLTDDQIREAVRSLDPLAGG